MRTTNIARTLLERKTCLHDERARPYTCALTSAAVVGASTPPARSSVTFTAAPAGRRSAPLDPTARRRADREHPAPRRVLHPGCRAPRRLRVRVRANGA